MRLKPETVLKDIEGYLAENSELPWGNAQVILMEAQTLIESQERVIKELEKTLSIMEGEYPEPTVFAKITEFNSLEEAYNRIAELEKKQQEILKEVKTSWTAVSPVKNISRESAHQLYELIKEITE